LRGVFDEAIPGYRQRDCFAKPRNDIFGEVIPVVILRIRCEKPAAEDGLYYVCKELS
jgi:hypothetical protein